MDALKQNGCTGTKRESHIDEALSRLQYQIETLEANADQICTRLDRALRSEPQSPTCDQNKVADNITVTPLAANIVGMTERISRANATFADILNRLEL